MSIFISKMDQVGNTNEYDYGITWAEGLSTGFNVLSMIIGLYFKKRFSIVLLSILFITLYYVLRTRDLKIYANNANTDLAPNIVYLSLSSLLLIFSIWIKPDAAAEYLDDVSHRDTDGMPKKQTHNFSK